MAALDTPGRTCRRAIVSNIDDDLLAANSLRRDFDLVCLGRSSLEGALRALPRDDGVGLVSWARPHLH
ncbi:MAG TPA: hypothetical protein VKX28_16805 [Xanthobacteraceae bacterium]|nr:hypothetical protein [Xanthobacteraceae bacterium]